MGAIIATAAVPAHLRLDDADTVSLPALPLGTGQVIAVLADPNLTDEQKMAQIAPGLGFEGVTAEEAVKYLGETLGVDPDDLIAAVYLLANEKVVREAMAGLRTDTTAVYHPEWEAACIPGDTPLHVSQEWAVKIPSGVKGKTTTLSVQVQQNDGEPADLWLDGQQVSVDDAEQHARNMLAAVELGRRINAARESGTEAAA